MDFRYLLSKKIVIFYKSGNKESREWAERILDNIAESIQEEYRRKKDGIFLNNGSSVLIKPASESIRGLPVDIAIVSNQIDYKMVEELIHPCLHHRQRIFYQWRDYAN